MSSVSFEDSSFVLRNLASFACGIERLLEAESGRTGPDALQRNSGLPEKDKVPFKLYLHLLVEAFERKQNDELPTCEQLVTSFKQSRLFPFLLRSKARQGAYRDDAALRELAYRVNEFVALLMPSSTSIELDLECDDSTSRYLAPMLERKTSITKLRLSSRSSDIGEHAMSALSTMLEKNTTITSLDLRHAKIPEAGICALATGLQKNNSLVALDLSSHDVGNDGASALSTMLEKNTTITSLNLRRAKIPEVGVCALATALQKNNSLVALDLSSNDVGNDGASALSTMLEKNTTITSLNLRRAKIPEAGLCALAIALPWNSSLLDLDLSFNDVGDDGASTLATSLEKNLSLTKLSLSKCSIGDRGACALAALCEKNPRLTKVRLKQNNIGDQGAHAWGDVLANNSTITALAVTGSKLTDEGMCALVAPLESNTAVVSVSLGGDDLGVSSALSKFLSSGMIGGGKIKTTGISDVSVMALSNVLRSNSTVTSLKLRRTALSPNGACALVGAFAVNSSITCLDLGANEWFEDRGALALAAVLHENTSLTSVRLNDCGIGDQGAFALASALEHNLHVRFLDVSNHSSVFSLRTNVALSKQALSGIEQALQRNEGRREEIWRTCRALVFCWNELLDSRLKLGSLPSEILGKILVSICPPLLQSHDFGLLSKGMSHQPAETTTACDPASSSKRRISEVFVETEIGSGKPQEKRARKD